MTLMLYALGACVLAAIAVRVWWWWRGRWERLYKRTFELQGVPNLSNPIYSALLGGARSKGERQRPEGRRVTITARTFKEVEEKLEGVELTAPPGDVVVLTPGGSVTFPAPIEGVSEGERVTIVGLGVGEVKPE